MVTFNSNQAKEVGTNHTVGTPYFSPPEDNRDLRVASMPSVTPEVLTAARFQDLGRAAHQYCLCIMDRRARTRSEQLDHIVPWKLAESINDAFRVPLWHVIVARAGFEALLSEPTILLPTRDNVMKLFHTIKSFPELTEGLKKRLGWARHRLHNDGSQYDIRSHLEAKKEAAALTSQSPSLLRQFLAQTEPPERRVSAEEMDDAGDTDGELSVSDEQDSEPELELESDGESPELLDELSGDVW
ncbi:hypothetical protein MAJ_11356, partial [Metarhizium majus ARSEF 297]